MTKWLLLFTVKNNKNILCLFLSFVVIFCCVCYAQAVEYTVHATGQYMMTDTDSKKEAVKKAVEDAERNALEQVCTYVESHTELENAYITHDIVKTMAVGVIRVVAKSTKIIEDINKRWICIADITAKINPDEIDFHKFSRKYTELARETALLEKELLKEKIITRNKHYEKTGGKYYTDDFIYELVNTPLETGLFSKQNTIYDIVYLDEFLARFNSAAEDNNWSSEIYNKLEKLKTGDSLFEIYRCLPERSYLSVYLVTDRIKNNKAIKKIGIRENFLSTGKKINREFDSDDMLKIIGCIYGVYPAAMKVIKIDENTCSLSNKLIVKKERIDGFTLITIYK